MNYLIIYEGDCYYASFFDIVNSYKKGMTVIDMVSNRYTSDGVLWFKLDNYNK